MRKLRIPMSQAAKARLDLLRDPDALPVPIDLARLHPFGYRFEGEIMSVTFQGRDIAFVPASMVYGEKAFALRVVPAQNDTVDQALRTFFAVLTADLDRNGSVLAAQKREAQKREKAEAEANQEATLAEVDRRVDGLRRCFLPEPSPTSLHPLTERELTLAKSASAPTDAWRVERGGRASVNIVLDRDLGLRVGLTITADGTNVFTLYPHPHKADMLTRVRTRLREESPNLDINADVLIAGVRDIATRNARVLDQDAALAALGRVESTEYDITLAAIRPPVFPRDVTGPVADLGDGFVLVHADNGVALTRDGCPVLDFRFRPYVPEHSTFPDEANTAFGTVGSVFPHAFAEKIPTDRYAAVGGLWLRTLHESHPEADFSACLPVPEEEILRAAETLDPGYL